MVRLPYTKDTLPIPEGVQVSIENTKVTISGPNGQLVQDFGHSPISLQKQDNDIILEVKDARKKELAILGTIKAHINNMISGVSMGFRYKLKIVYAHFPIQTKVEDDRILIINFTGEKAPRVAKFHGEVNVSVKGDDIIVEGANIQDVAQTAANIQASCRIKGKDHRVFQDGVFVFEKGVIKNE